MPSWRYRKDGGTAVATTTANREVGTQIEVEHLCELGFTCVCERNPGHSHGPKSTTRVKDYPAPALQAYAGP